MVVDRVAVLLDAFERFGEAPPAHQVVDVLDEAGLAVPFGRFAVQPLRIVVPADALVRRRREPAQQRRIRLAGEGALEPRHRLVEALLLDVRRRHVERRLPGPDLVVDHRVVRRVELGRHHRVVGHARLVVAPELRQQVAAREDDVRVSGRMGEPVVEDRDRAFDVFAAVGIRAGQHDVADREERPLRSRHGEHPLERLDPDLEVAGRDRRDAEVEP